MRRHRGERVENPDVAGRRGPRGGGIARQRQPPDDHRPRAAEPRGKDDHVPLQQHRIHFCEHSAGRAKGDVDQAIKETQDACQKIYDKYNQ